MSSQIKKIQNEQYQQIEYITKKIGNYIKNKSDTNYFKQNKKTNRSKKISFNPNNSLGIYIPYSLLNTDPIFEFLDESSLMIKNIDSYYNIIGNNIFKWRNVLDNKINNLIYIYVHIVTLPLYPYLNKYDIDLSLVSNATLLSISNNLTTKYNNNELNIDTNISIDSNIINVSYYDEKIIDFIINETTNNLYSIEFNSNKTSFKLYLYERSNKSIIDEAQLYLDIDLFNNLKVNEHLSTSHNQNKFNFQLIPISQTSNFIYYKGMGQYIQKSLNDLVNIDTFNVQLFGTSHNILTNTFINKSSKFQTYKPLCDCINENNNDGNFKSSCYCKYIRHPYNLNNQIDIGLKIGQIKTELVHNIFH